MNNNQPPPDEIRDLIMKLRHGLCSTRMVAAQQVAALGPRAVAAIPALLPMLCSSDPSIREQAEKAAWAAGDSSLPFLLPLLIDTDPEIRCNAFYATKFCAPISPVHTSLFMAALADETAYVRAIAAEAVGRIHPPSPEIVAALTRLGRDHAPTVRAGAATGLGLAGGSLNPDVCLRPGLAKGNPGLLPLVVRALLALLKDDDYRVSLAAAYAIGFVGPPAKIAVETLVSFLKSDDNGLRHAALFTLKHIETGAAISVPVLYGPCWTENRLQSRVRTNNNETETDEIPHLILKLRDGTWSEKMLAARRVAELGEEAVATIPALLPMLHNLDHNTREQAEEAAQAAGNSSLPFLLPLLTDPDPQLRSQAFHATRFCALIPPVHAPTFLAALEDENVDVRASAAEAIGRIHPPLPEIIATLCRLTRDQAPTIRASAATGLGLAGGRLDPDRRLRPGIAKGDPSLLLPVIRALLALLKDDDYDVSLAAAYAIGFVGPPAKIAVETLVSFLKSDDFGRRNAALFALRRIGTAAAIAVPALMERLYWTENRWLGTHGDVVHDWFNEGHDCVLVQEALAAIGTAAVPPLIECVVSNRGKYQRVAASALGRMGEPAIPAVLELLRQQNADVQEAAWHALRMMRWIALPAIYFLLIGATRKRARFEIQQFDLVEVTAYDLPCVMSLLHHESELIRRRAIDAIGRIGPHAQEALPVIKTLFKTSARPKGRDDCHTTRHLAALALAELGDINKTTVSLLIDLLRCERPRTLSIRAERVLSRSTVAIAKLNKLLRSRKHSDRKAAIAVLAAIGKDASIAVPNIIRLLRDSDETIRHMAGGALRAMRPVPRATTTEVIHLLRHRDWRVRVGAITALRRLDCVTSSVIVALTPLLKDNVTKVRRRTAFAICIIGPKTRRVVLALLSIFPSFTTRMRRLIVKSIGCGAAVLSALPLLIEAVRSSASVGVCIDALRILENLGPEAQDAAPAILEAMHRHSHIEVGLQALRTLGRLQSRTPEVIATFIECLRADNEQMREMAIRSLVNSGETAIPALWSVLEGEDKPFRQIVAPIIAAIGPVSAQGDREIIERFGLGAIDIVRHLRVFWEMGKILRENGMRPIGDGKMDELLEGKKVDKLIDNNLPTSERSLPVIVREVEKLYKVRLCEPTSQDISLRTKTGKLEVATWTEHGWKAWTLIDEYLRALDTVDP